MMHNELHGHEVIAYIKNAHPQITKKELYATLHKQFGDVTFYTCSESGMTLKELLTFLEEKEKLVFVNGLATINTGNICSDGD